MHFDHNLVVTHTGQEASVNIDGPDVVELTGTLEEWRTREQPTPDQQNPQAAIDTQRAGAPTASLLLGEVPEPVTSADITERSLVVGDPPTCRDGLIFTDVPRESL